MPILPALISNAEVTILGTSATGGSSVTPSINVFHFKRTTTVNALSKAALNAIFQTNILTPLLAAMNVRYTPTNVTVRWLDDALDIPQFFAAAGVGAIATDSLPSDDAVFFLYRTALRGRSYRGAKHFSPASEVDTTNDLLTGAGLARWNTVKAALLANNIDANGNTWAPSVLSRKLSTLTTNPTNVVNTFVTDVLLDLNIGTMRRRRSKTVR